MSKLLAAAGAQTEHLETGCCGLAGRAQEIQDHHPERTQLTADQAAAVLSVLTDGTRVSVINAPAGSGKTRVMTEAARVWAAAGRPVAGITPRAVRPQYRGRRGGRVLQHRPVPGTPCPASAEPAARSTSPRTRCCWSTSPR